MIKSILKPILKSINLGFLNPVGGYRFAIRYSGASNYATIETKLIDMDGDNFFAFYSPSSDEANRTIVAQNITATQSSREFHLFVAPSADAVNGIRCVFGGTMNNILSVAQGYQNGRRYYLSIIGETFSISKDNLSNVVRAGSFSRGVAREASARTIVGARGNGVGSFSLYFIGIQYNLIINGNYYPMGSKNEALQFSNPDNTYPMTLTGFSADQWERIKLN